MFKKDDKVKVISGVNAFIGKTGIVMESNDTEVKVQFNLADNDIENKRIINVFESTQLELDSIDNLLTESEEIAFENDIEEGLKYKGYTIDFERNGSDTEYFISGHNYKGDEFLSSHDYPYENALQAQAAIDKFLDRQGKLESIDERFAFDNKPENDETKPYKIEWQDNMGYEHLDQFAIKEEADKFYDKKYMDEWVSQVDKRYPINKESVDMNKNEIALTEAQLEKWMDDNDAEYWTQDIVDNKVSIRSFALREELGVYDFEKKTLTLNVPEEVDNEFEIEEEDPDFIYPYIHEVNIEDAKDVIPGWEFAGIIATGERMEEDVVIQCAQDLGYKVFCIECMNNVFKVIIAAKAIKEENIVDDYVKYLDGRPVIRELKK